MRTFAPDGRAVAACRALLEEQGIPGSANWRNTVVTEDGPRWVVRIWVSVPAQQSRPQGTPDYVYAVDPELDDGTGLRISQVHPSS